MGKPSTVPRVRLVHVLPNGSCDPPILPEDRAFNIEGQLIVSRPRLHKLHPIKLWVRVDDLAPTVDPHDKHDARLLSSLLRDLSRIDLVVKGVHVNAS